MAEPSSEIEKIGTVVARSLAFLCLKNSEANDGSVLQKAQFLNALGLPFADSAGLVGSTVASLNELARQAKKGKNGGKEAKGKSKTKGKSRRRK